MRKIVFSSTYKMVVLRIVLKYLLQQVASQMFVSFENLFSHSTYIHNTNTRSLYFEQTPNSLQVDMKV
jgi:hypothetical protein